MTADRTARGLVRTLVATSLVTIALGALLTWPRARLEPVRAVPFELDEPREETPGKSVEN